MGDVKWYHVAGAALLWWLWQKNEEKLAGLTAEAAAARAGQLDAEASAAANVDAEHRAALAARAEIAKRDAALAAQREITAETNAAVASSPSRVVLPPQPSTPPRVVATPPAAVENERTLAMDANMGDTRIVPREGSLSIVRDNTYGATPTVATEQQSMSLPTKKAAGTVVPEDLDDLRALRTY